MVAATQETSVKTRSKAPRGGFACKLPEFDRMCAWADACGFQNELFHVVVEKWTQVKTRH